MKKTPDNIGRAVYGIISLSLALISLIMIFIAIWNIWVSFRDNTSLVKSLLDAIGLIVIGMAVFDVSKFLIEEEVFHIRVSIKSPAKQRDTLVKFLVIIAISINLEALVFVFDAGKKDITLLIYPTFLLFAGFLIVIGLGIYQKLTQTE